MIQGLYAAANGILSMEDRQAVIANNIANSTTPGFKRQISVQEGFYQTFLGATKNFSRFDAMTAPGGGVKLTETFTDFANGIIAQTGNPFDVALIGPGFFAVETPEGLRFTRNGKFSLGVEGELVTNDGYKVLSVDGNSITLGAGSVTFGSDGTVRVDGEVAGLIRIVEFDDNHMLTREGFNLYIASDAAQNRSHPATSTTVAAQSLESSNVSTAGEMVQMMLALRGYEANQRVIMAIDETTRRLIDQVGAPS